MPHPIKGADHAWQTGVLLGCFLRHGWDVVPVIDADNYTAELVITVVSPVGGTIEVRVVVLEPDMGP